MLSFKNALREKQYTGKNIIVIEEYLVIGTKCSSFVYWPAFLKCT
jgi:hypothetical protein